MKILLVSNYLHDRQESMLRFAAALSDGLRAAGIDVTLVRPEPLLGRLRPGGGGLGKWLGYLDKFLLFPPRLRRLAHAADLVHICDHSNAMYVPHVSAHPHLLTCNDLLAVRSALGEFPQNRTGWTGRVLQRWILAGLRQARRVTCISEATRRDVLRLSGPSTAVVTVTYMGQNFAYSPVSEVAEAASARRFGRPFDAAVFQRHGLPTEPYILHVGGSQWYKNREGVFAMHAALQTRLGASTPRLVVVGPPPYAPGVEARTGVENPALAELYSGAELLLFPSLEEGFGWPIIEAQACGCRVLTTGKPPMTEVGGTAAFYLSDPTDAGAGAETMSTLLAQDEAAATAASLAGRENAGRFSTERMVGEYLAIYRAELSLRMKRPLLHVIHSLNPAHGGPVEVVRQLCAAHAALGVASEVATLDSPRAPWLANWTAPVHPLNGRGGYGWTPALARWLRPRAQNYSGIFTHGLWQWQGAGTRLALQGTGARALVFPHGMLDPWFRHAYPWRHLRKAIYWRLVEQRVIRDAAAVIFTCEEEQRLGRETFQPWTAQREAIVPLGTTAPTRETAELRDLFLARFPALRDQRLLLFLGRLHDKKGPDLLVEAFRRVAPPLHLVFAGPCADPRYLAHLQQLAHGLPVTFTGPLYGDEKWGALAAAEVFVLPSHQENFGMAVAEVLAVGLPVLISQRVNIWREITEAGAGFAETDDLAGTERLLTRWLTADHAAMRLAAQTCFTAQFDIRKTAGNLLALLSPPA